MKHTFLKQLITALLLSFLSGIIASAKIVLPSVFSDNMVSSKTPKLPFGVPPKSGFIFGKRIIYEMKKAEFYTI